MNVVRYKLKPDCVNDYFQAVNKTKFEGIKQKYIAKTKASITVLLVLEKWQCNRISETCDDCSS